MIIRRMPFMTSLMLLGCASTSVPEPTIPEPPIRSQFVVRTVEEQPDERHVLTLAYRSTRDTGRSTSLRFAVPHEAIPLDQWADRSAWPVFYARYQLPSNTARLSFSAYSRFPALDRVVCVEDFETLRATYGGHPVRVEPSVNEDGVCLFTIRFRPYVEGAGSNAPASYLFRERVRVIQRYVN